MAILPPAPRAIRMAPGFGADDEHRISAARPTDEGLHIPPVLADELPTSRLRVSQWSRSDNSRRCIADQSGSVSSANGQRQVSAPLGTPRGFRRIMRLEQGF